MRTRILSVILVACAVFAAGAGDINTRPTWPSTVQGSMIVDAVTPLQVTKDLHGWWPMEEGSGTNTADVSGAGNDGTLTNGAGWGAGLLGQYSVDCDGVNDYVDAGTSAGDFDHTDAFSVSFWLKLDITTTNYNFFVGKQDTSERGWRVDNGGLGDRQKVSVFIINTPGTNLIRLVTNSEISYASKNHISFTYNGSLLASGVTVYVNGVSVATTIIKDSLSATIKTSSPMSFCIREDDLVGEVSGLIDDVRLYDRELNASEVMAIASGQG